MRALFIIVLFAPLALLSSLSCLAQTVEKVSGSSATLDLSNSAPLSVGDKVQFLNEDLNVSGQGEVTKISSGGTKAIVKITSGEAKKGTSFESISPAHKAPPSKDNERFTSRPPESEYLSEEDRRILRIGEISNTSYVIGGILGTYPFGLGIGHAIQGRYLDKGWIFTVGELSSAVLIFASLGDCWDSSSERWGSCSGGGVALGLTGFLAFRIWEIIDVWAAPIEINRRYRELQQRRGSRVSWTPLIAPTKDGAVLGLKMTF